MKKTTLFIFAMAFSVFANSQPTINTSDIIPVVGEQFTTQTSTYTNPGASGAGVTWNFSSLTTSGSYTYNYSNPSSTPFSANFPGATHCIISGGTSYSYQKSSATEWNDMGWASSTSGYYCNYSNPKLLMSFPFNYNATVNDSYYGSYTAGSTQIVNQGTVQYKYDGYGTLILPTGTINNVVRFKITDAATNSSGTFSYTQTQTTYMWFKPGEHCPVLYLSETVTVSTTTTTSNYAYYHTPSAIGIDENNQSNNFLLFPNPASEKITVLHNSNNLHELVVTDVLGKTIQLKKVDDNTGNIELNIQHLSKGIYFAHLKDYSGTVLSVIKFQKN